MAMDTFINVEFASNFLINHQDMLETIWSQNISQTLGNTAANIVAILVIRRKL